MHTAYALHLNDMCFETTAGARTYPQTPLLRLFSNVLLFAATARGRLQSFAWTREKQSRGKCLQARLAEIDSRKVWRNWRIEDAWWEPRLHWVTDARVIVSQSQLFSFLQKPWFAGFHAPVWLLSKILGPDLSTETVLELIPRLPSDIAGHMLLFALRRQHPSPSTLYLKGCCC